MGENYTLISDIYDIMYDKNNGFDHEKDVKWVDKWRRKFKLDKRLLDLACGTGNHISEFTKLGYKVSGIDISEGMVKIARKRNKGVNIAKGNFKTFKGKRKYPLITSFFNSMGYNDSEKDLLKTFKCCISFYPTIPV